MRANIDECIAYVVFDVTASLDNPPNALGRMNTWLQSMFTNDNAPFDQAPPAPNPDSWRRENMDQQSVLAWVVPTLFARNQMEALMAAVTSNELQNINTAIDLVHRTLWAAKEAEDKQRITAAQLANIVGVYNLAWFV